jgi:hypothetical protein
MSMVMATDQNARQNNIKNSNKSFESVVEFKYLKTILTNQNHLHREMKSRVYAGYACYRKV